MMSIRMCDCILCVLPGLCMIGVAGAMVGLDYSGTIKAFLDTFNGNIYDGAVVTLFVFGSLYIICGLILWSETSELMVVFWIIWVILMIVTLVACVFGGIFLDMVENQLDDIMIGQVKNDYYNETSSDQISVAWNGMHEEFGCCGAVDYRDYRDSLYNKTSGTLVPFTCCKNESSGGVEICRQEARIPINPKCDGQSPTVGKWVQLNPCGCHAQVSHILEQAGIAFFVVNLTILIITVAVLCIIWRAMDMVY